MPKGKSRLTNAERERLERFAGVVERATKVLRPRMEQALRDLDKGLPPARSGELLSSRISW